MDGMGHTNTETERKTKRTPWLAMAAAALLLMAPGAVAQGTSLDGEGSAHAGAYADVDTSVVSDVQTTAHGTVDVSTNAVSETQEEIDSAVRGTVSDLLLAEAEARAEAEGEVGSVIQMILDARDEAEAEARAEARAQTEDALEAQAEARAEAQVQVLMAYELVGAIENEAEGEVGDALDTLVYLEGQAPTSADAHAEAHVDADEVLGVYHQACAASLPYGGASFLAEVAGGPLYATGAGSLVSSAELGELCGELGYHMQGSTGLYAGADAHAEAETGFFAQVRSAWDSFISLF